MTSVLVIDAVQKIDRIAVSGRTGAPPVWWQSVASHPPLRWTHGEKTGTVCGMSASANDIESIIDSLHRAAVANQATPGRVGASVHLAGDLAPALAEETLIAGDLHGHRANFEALVELADLDHHPGRHFVLQEVCHGGDCYPDQKGCMSHTLLEDVAGLILRFPNRVHFILGNHELAELTDYPIQKNRQLLNLAFRLGLRYRYGAAAERISAAYAEFFLSCPLAVWPAPGVLACHSIPEFVDTRGFDASVFERPLEAAEMDSGGSVFRLLWGRDYRQLNAEAFAEVVGAQVIVNGHEPCPGHGFKVPNRIQIILDCCNRPACYLTVPADEAASHEALVSRIRELP